jgi:hypothetical protein
MPTADVSWLANPKMSLVDTLAGFFNGPDDWPYVMGYQEYGIVSAHVDPPPSGFQIVRKRIVISLESDHLLSIIQTGFMSAYHWECADLGEDPLDPIVYRSTHDLFESFRNE